MHKAGLVLTHLFEQAEKLCEPGDFETFYICKATDYYCIETMITFSQYLFGKMSVPYFSFPSALYARCVGHSEKYTAASSKYLKQRSNKVRYKRSTKNSITLQLTQSDLSSGWSGKEVQSDNYTNKRKNENEWKKYEKKGL